MIRVIVHSYHLLDVNFIMLPFQQHKGIPRFHANGHFIKRRFRLLIAQEEVNQSFNKKYCPYGESGNKFR